MIESWLIESLKEGKLQLKNSTLDNVDGTLTVAFKIIKDRLKVVSFDEEVAVTWAIACKSHRARPHAKASLAKVIRDNPTATPEQLASRWVERVRHSAIEFTEPPSLLLYR